MSFDKEKELFAHKLEKKRIWLSRSLAAIVAGLVGWGAFLIAPEFAHELKLNEFKHQRELEVSKLWETSKIEKAIEGFFLIDSLHNQAFDTYKEAKNGFEIRGEKANYEASAAALTEASHKLYNSARMYSSYWSEDFSTQIQLNALVFQGVAKTGRSEWSQFSEFLWDLLMIRYTLQLEFIDQKISMQNGHIREDLFRLDKYESPNSSMKDKSEYNKTYLRENYDKWVTWRSSVRPVEK